MAQLDYLPNSVLARCSLLPEKPISIKPTGQHIYLEPLVLDRDVQALFEFSNGGPINLNGHSIDAYDPNEVIWRYMFDEPTSIKEITSKKLRPAERTHTKYHVAAPIGA